jgi:hypothetical protein
MSAVVCYIQVNSSPPPTNRAKFKPKKKNFKENRRI